MTSSNLPEILDKKTVDELCVTHAAEDAAVGIELSDEFAPFHQRNDVFTRAFWDDSVRSKHTEGFFKSYRDSFTVRKGDGFGRKDFALRNAAWSISNMVADRTSSGAEREGFLAPVSVDSAIATTPLEIKDPSRESAEIKSIAKLFGADLVGITHIDLRWHYASRVDNQTLEAVSNEIPEHMSHVIVMGHSMDYDLVETYPSALAGASTGLEYSHEAAIATQLASYIRNLGFDALASMNDTALVIPYAIKAGLGEYGRNQMLLTPEYGPRVRFSKIFTNMPLQIDSPRPFGIKEYCEICQRCAEACPPKALPFGDPTEQRISISTISGVKKWSSQPEKCFGYWASLKSDCAICMRVCPFNRRYVSWADRFFRRIATSRWRKFAYSWESFLGIRERLKPKSWWQRQLKKIRTRIVP